MITLHEHPDNIQLCKLRAGKKTLPVYWHPVRNPQLRLAVQDLNSFATEEMRDRFHLSQKQMSDILTHIKKGTQPEGGLQAKFFKLKRHIECSLYTEMDLRDSDQVLQRDFPPGSESWPEHGFYCGCSGGGKTYALTEMIKRNLDGPLKHKRKFVFISAEWGKDKTLRELKKEKYRRWVHGIDVSDNAFEVSEHSDVQTFFDRDVKPAIDYAQKGNCICFDDPMDAVCSEQLRPLINKLLRCARHDGLGLNFILHRLRSGIWSSQGHSSCKWFTLFPRSQKGQIRDFLNKDIGCTLNEARDHVHDFASAARAMTVRLHAPQCIMSKKLLRLL